jgi:nitrous oxide reductase
MSRETGKQDNSRRSFLRGLAVMGGVTAVAASTGADVVESTTKPAPSAEKPEGYRVTPHVAKYYDKARI